MRNIFNFGSKEYVDERGREYYFDNAKFILIFLVVFAHAISPLKTGNTFISMLWTVVNTLHMPCLIFISGYFAKGYVKSDGTVKAQRWFTYVIYYVAAQIAVGTFEYYVLGYKTMVRSLFSPRSSLWYLMCLIMWFMVLPLVAKVKPIYMMIFAVVMGLLVGYDTGLNNVLSMYRVVNHFPIFLLGYYFKKEWVYKFRNIKTQIASAIVLVFICIFTYKNINIIPARIITSAMNYYYCYLKTFTSEPLMFMNRLLFYVAALVLCACFMLLVPRRKTIYTKLGARTLQVYILHRFLYLAELEYKWYDYFKGTEGFIKMSIIAFVLTIVLSLKPFEYIFKALGKIKLSWFEVKEK